MSLGDEFQQTQSYPVPGIIADGFGLKKHYLVAPDYWVWWAEPAYPAHHVKSTTATWAPPASWWDQRMQWTAKWEQLVKGDEGTIAHKSSFLGGPSSPSNPAPNSVGGSAHGASATSNATGGSAHAASAKNSGGNGAGVETPGNVLQPLDCQRLAPGLLPQNEAERSMWWSWMEKPKDTSIGGSMLDMAEDTVQSAVEDFTGEGSSCATPITLKRPAGAWSDEDAESFKLKTMGEAVDPQQRQWLHQHSLRRQTLKGYPDVLTPWGVLTATPRLDRVMQGAKVEKEPATLDMHLPGRVLPISDEAGVGSVYDGQVPKMKVFDTFDRFRDFFRQQKRVLKTDPDWFKRYAMGEFSSQLGASPEVGQTGWTAGGHQSRQDPWQGRAAEQWTAPQPPDEAASYRAKWGALWPKLIADLYARREPQEAIQVAKRLADSWRHKPSRSTAEDVMENLHTALQTDSGAHVLTPYAGSLDINAGVLPGMLLLQDCIPQQAREKRAASSFF